ncbi:MAG: RadC family protein [Candidatus Villigracilaceae bacterium]
MNDASSRPTYRITDLNVSDRPRERLAKLGPQALTNAELLAILLRVGVPGENAVDLGQRLLNTFDGLTGLHSAPFEELIQQHGLGEAKAAQIKAAIELGKRLSLEAPEERPIIKCPADAAALVQYEMSGLEKEQMRVFLLDTRNRVLDIVQVAYGSVNSAHIRIAEVFTPAVRRNATAILLAHNHPSGDPSPSPDDIAVTRNIVQAGKLLDIDVLDHIIIGIGDKRWVSLKERGVEFT